MLFVISELIVKFWSTPNRQLANTLVNQLAQVFTQVTTVQPALDAIGLELVEELSNRGVQLLIAFRIVLLLRQGGNEEIFLESCLLDSSEDTYDLPDNGWMPPDCQLTLPDQSFLLLNILLPYLIGQVETGPPIRVIHIDPKPPQASLCRSFQHHLGLRPPLILVPSPPPPLMLSGLSSLHSLISPPGSTIYIRNLEPSNTLLILNTSIKNFNQSRHLSVLQFKTKKLD
ncbi:hypothetical protein PSHT_11610 [Puccinia striiformis]|uniref:Uncharacterized protein n=1 Tax=Puccinia striiformis TaxID=27350 RepID=A0A2S4V260_9BASI|nr:hypothetical protein PSHT_11610 [Puccinia striiformis]